MNAKAKERDRTYDVTFRNADPLVADLVYNIGAYRKEQAERRGWFQMVCDGKTTKDWYHVSTVYVAPKA